MRILGQYSGCPYSIECRIRGLSRENPPRDQRSKSKNLRDLFSISVSLRDLLRASVSVREPFPASSKDFSTFELVLVEKQLLLREYSLASLVVLPPFRLTHSSTLSLTHVVSSLTQSNTLSLTLVSSPTRSLANQRILTISRLSL